MLFIYSELISGPVLIIITSNIKPFFSTAFCRKNVCWRLTVPKCLGSAVSWVRSVLTPWYVRRGNFGDSRTFNAVIRLLLIFACVLRTSSPEIGFLGAKWGKGGAMFTPNELLFTFGFFTSVPILVNIHQEMRAWECMQTDTRTEANWFL